MALNVPASSASARPKRAMIRGTPDRRPGGNGNGNAQARMVKTDRTEQHRQWRLVARLHRLGLLGVLLWSARHPHAHLQPAGRVGAARSRLRTGTRRRLHLCHVQDARQRRRYSPRRNVGYMAHLVGAKVAIRRAGVLTRTPVNSEATNERGILKIPLVA